MKATDDKRHLSLQSVLCHEPNGLSHEGLYAKQMAEQAKTEEDRRHYLNITARESLDALHRHCRRKEWHEAQLQTIGGDD